MSGSTRAQDQFHEIFNGHDLTGWKGNPKLWSVEDGAITGRTSAEDPIRFNTFLVWEQAEVADFVLELDYRIVGSGGNSGIQYRSKVLDAANFVVGGYQADIDESMKFTGINYEEKGRGILAQRGERVTISEDGNKQAESFGEAVALAEKIHAIEWNHYTVTALGNKVTHQINGQLMSEVIDHEKEKAASRGVLAFQVHVGPPMVIQFKNIRLKTLK
jgi:hypothetical protein